MNHGSLRTGSWIRNRGASNEASEIPSHCYRIRFVAVRDFYGTVGTKHTHTHTGAAAHRSDTCAARNPRTHSGTDTACGNTGHTGAHR